MSPQRATGTFSNLKVGAPHVVTLSRQRSALNIEKAKEKARKFEAKNQHDKAIEQYKKILKELEGTPELEGELALFNRLGDLYLKVNKTHEAVETYERAADLYEQSGLQNNAIALCNKILRSSPGRTQTYLRLARLMLGRGFAAEAKKNLIEYTDRMQKAGQLEQAVGPVQEFAELASGNEEIRMLVAELLEASGHSVEAEVQRLRASQQMTAITDEGKGGKAKAKSKGAADLVFIDLDEPEAASAPVAEPEEAAEPEELEIETTAIAEPEEVVEPEELEIETTAMAEPEEAVEELPHEETEEVQIERASVELAALADDVETMEGLELTVAEEEVESAEMPSLEIETTALDDTFVAEEVAEKVEEEAAVPEEAEIDLGGFDAVAEEAPVEASVDLEPAAAAPPDIPALEAEAAENPDDPALLRALGEALLESGESERGLEELDKALAAAENKEDWGLSEDLVEEILRLDPNSVRHHQKRVELAYRSNDQARMVEYYLALADALLRQGSMDRSRNVYHRVLELDPENDAAKAALETLGPPEEEAAEGEVAAAAAPGGGEGGEAGGDFVDLGALILGDEEPSIKDTRMRIEEEEPTGDEDRDFAEMLAEFKKGIAANVEEEDWQAHYDLGIAFKEMGLLDEAIAELQKALRSSEGRLKSSEALGMCFYEKGQFAVAATVLKRAIDGDPRGDDEKIGLLYWLGRCEEEQGKPAGALDYYQRVFAVDIGFQDVSDRVKSLAKAES